MIKFGPSDLETVMALGSSSLPERSSCAVIFMNRRLYRKPSGRIRYAEVHQAYQAGIREGLLPLSTH